MNDPIRYENWKFAEFGRCPACGAIGMVEAFPSMDSDKVWFECTREDCRTNFPRTTVFNTTPFCRIWSHTSWIERKPKWWKKHQEKYKWPYLWNESRFSQVFCRRHHLV